MSRFCRMLGAALTGLVIAATGSGAITMAQDSTSPDLGLRAQLASITLDASALPGGYIFSGETFLGADQVTSGDIAAEDLTGAGFITHYLSEYRNPDTGHVISSYVSAWNDAESAEAGFGIVEDEARSQPDGAFEDAEASVGESPGETTTGTFPDSQDGSVTVSTTDITFRIDRFLVGASLETRDGTVAGIEIVQALAATLEGRATAAIGGESPGGTDLDLVSQALPLSGLGVELQAGFLGTTDVEYMYGLQGSVLGGFNASWSAVAGLGEGDTLQPYVSIGLTSFGSAEDASAIVDQIDDLSPQTPGAEPVEGVEIEGAGAVAAFVFPSQATGATEADSFRVVAVAESSLVVIDVQGAPSADIAQQTATALASAQIGCIGQDACPAPELPAELTGQ